MAHATPRQRVHSSRPLEPARVPALQARDARAAEPGGAPETVDRPPTKRHTAITQKRVAEAGRKLVVAVGACGDAFDGALVEALEGARQGP
jgi:hypothetical protein